MNKGRFSSVGVQMFRTVMTVYMVVAMATTLLLLYEEYKASQEGVARELNCLKERLTIHWPKAFGRLTLRGSNQMRTVCWNSPSSQVLSSPIIKTGFCFPDLKMKKPGRGLNRRETAIAASKI